MTSFQHQLTIEFVTTSNSEEQYQNHGVRNRLHLQDYLNTLINKRVAEELYDEPFGVVDHRVTNAYTQEIDGSIRRRGGQFYNFTLMREDIKSLWNNRLRYVNAGRGIFTATTPKTIVDSRRNDLTNNRHLIVSSDSHFGTNTFTFPKLEDAVENTILDQIIWDEIRDEIHEKINNVVNDTIRSIVLRRMNGCFEDGLIDCIREAAIDKHLEEAFASESATNNEQSDFHIEAI